MTQSCKVDAKDVLWPPLQHAFNFLGGGWWHNTGTVLTASFFESGCVGQYFVGKRLATLNQGVLTVEVDVAASALPHLFSKWANRLAQSDAAAKVRDGHFWGVLSSNHTAMLKSMAKRPRLDYSANRKPPRCVQLALAMPPAGPGDTRRAWKHVMRWHLASVVASYADLTNTTREHVLSTFFTPVMLANGVSTAAVTEFAGYTKRAKTSDFPCHKRRQNEGLWCPIGTAACAEERGIEHTADMTVASVWASR